MKSTNPAKVIKENLTVAETKALMDRLVKFGSYSKRTLLRKLKGESAWTYADLTTIQAVTKVSPELLLNPINQNHATRL